LTPARTDSRLVIGHELALSSFAVLIEILHRAPLIDNPNWQINGCHW
jgi:hypothetical protein